MPKNKPRGSQSGLARNRLEVKQKNSRLLKETIQNLSISRPEERWTYKKVCQASGLKSTVALHKPWNREIREIIDQHNAKIQKNEKSTLLNTETKSNPKSNLMEITQQRNEALAKIAKFQANAEHYKNKYEKLLLKFENMKKNKYRNP